MNAKSIILSILTFLLATTSSFAQDVESYTGDIYMVVENMPRFPGCEKQGAFTASQLKSCADMKMIKYIYDMLEYPQEAKEYEVEGTLFVRFVVEKDGNLTNFQITRSLGFGCDEEALRIVKSFPKWIAGKQRGEPVRVQFDLPIKFKLP